MFKDQLSEGKKSWYTALAHFCGVNTPILADFKIRWNKSIFMEKKKKKIRWNRLWGGAVSSGPSQAAVSCPRAALGIQDI